MVGWRHFIFAATGTGAVALQMGQSQTDTLAAERHTIKEPAKSESSGAGDAR